VLHGRPFFDGLGFDYAVKCCVTGAIIQEFYLHPVFIPYSLGVIKTQ
jgi:hypothetical protein